MTAEEFDKLGHEEVEALGYKRYHTSMIREYISRKGKGQIVRSYKGKFGEGFVVLSCNYKSSRYSFVTYYIKSGA